MSRDCPRPELIRALAEDALTPEEAHVAAHVAGCARCAEALTAARAEEAALRAALDGEPPAGLLASIGAALDADAGAAPPPAPVRRVRRRTQPSSGSGALAAGVLLAAAALGLAAWLREAPRPQPSPAPTAPAPTAPAPTASETATPHTPAPTPRPSPNPTSAPSPRPTATATPSPEVVVERPTATPTPRPSATPTSAPSPRTSPTTAPPRALARLRGGKLKAGKATLAPGDPLPSDAELVAAGPVEVELTERARVQLERRTRFQVRAPKGALPARIELLRGRLFTRTAGKRPYAISTAEGVAAPLGTAFLVERARGRTRVTTVEGAVQLAAGDDLVLVRSGFQAAARANRLTAALPWKPTRRALGWLPKAARPTRLPRPGRIVRGHDFERGLEGFTRGERVAKGARGSRGCLRGVAFSSDYAVGVELEDTRAGVVQLDPELWIEVSCKVDREARVVLQIWNADARQNLAHFVTLAPGRWTPVAAPLKRFGDARGKPRTAPVRAGSRGTCFNVFAGEPGERVQLLVDDVRFVRP